RLPSRRRWSRRAGGAARRGRGRRMARASVARSHFVSFLPQPHRRPHVLHRRCLPGRQRHRFVGHHERPASAHSAFFFGFLARFFCSSTSTSGGGGTAFLSARLLSYSATASGGGGGQGNPSAAISSTISAGLGRTAQRLPKYSRN